MPTPATNGVVEWSWDEEKAFESALAEDNETSNDDGGGDDDERRRKKKKSGGGGGGMDWEWIASKVGSKTPAEVRVHYKMLVEDIEAIEAGKIPIPRYVGEESAIKEKEHGNYSHKNSNNQQQQNSNNLLDRRGFEGKGCSKAEQERKKGIPWTEEEHRLFLLGLDKFGKGDWRSISRNFVVSRTPTQVASHAQKYFIRLNSMNRDRRRSSIHDITMVNGENSSSSAQGPITGQTNGNPAALVGPSPMEHAVQGVGMYSPPMGHPVTGHMVSAAVGTPVMLPPGHPPYVMPVAYPVPPPTMHQ